MGEPAHPRWILAGVVSFLLSVTFACGVVIAVAHVINVRFVAPVYDVLANLTAFASAVAASVMLHVNRSGEGVRGPSAAGVGRSSGEGSLGGDPRRKVPGLDRHSSSSSTQAPFL